MVSSSPIIVQRSTQVLNGRSYVQLWNLNCKVLFCCNMIPLVQMRRVPLEARRIESPVRIRKVVVEGYTKSLFDRT